VTKAKIATFRLWETTYAAPQSLKVDREAGVIRGVKVLGRESRNNRTYTEAALADAARLYEGADVNVDHPPPDAAARNRNVAEGLGVLRNVQLRGDGVYGDLHYLKSHALAEMVLERAERMPDRFGLSHNAEGPVRSEGGKWIVEGLERVFSVDLVRNPATNAGLFESVISQGKTMEKTTVKAVLEAVRAAAPQTPGLARLLEIGEDPAAAAAMSAPMEAPPAEASPEDQIKAALQAMVMQAYEAATPDVQTQVRELLGIGDPMAAASGGEGEESEAVEEAVKNLRAHLAAQTKREQVKDLLEDHGISRAVIGAERFKQLLEHQDPARLLASWPPSVTRPGERPRITPLHESAGPLAPVTDAKSFAAAITAD
jgi:hypothetical protein